MLLTEEDKRRVDPSSTKTKRVIKNPRFILNPARLTGPRGIQILPDHFKDFKFKGKLEWNLFIIWGFNAFLVIVSY